MQLPTGNLPFEVNYVPAGQGIRGPKMYTGFRPEGVCWHYTGNNKASAGANSHRKYWETAETGAHFVVDETKTILCAPLDEVIWHAGPGNLYIPSIKQRYPRGPNMSLIGVEICNNGNWTAAVERAKSLGVWLCRTFGLDPHKDFVRHYDCTRKQCPLAWADTTPGGPWVWANFKADVADKLKGGAGMPKNPTDQISREDKVKIMERAKEAGLITRAHDPEEIAEKWFPVALMLNAMDVLKKARG